MSHLTGEKLHWLQALHKALGVACALELRRQYHKATKRWRQEIAEKLDAVAADDCRSRGCTAKAYALDVASKRVDYGTAPRR